MNQLGIPSAHLIGYCLGANVALYIAVQNLQRVRSLVTIGTSGFCDPAGADEFEPEWLVEQEMQAMIDQMTERHMEAHKGDWKSFMRQSAQDWRLYPQLTKQQLTTISCAALFITGEHDPFAGEAKVKRLASMVQGSESLVVPGGSHRPHMIRENPVFVNDAILHFLEKHNV